MTAQIMTCISVINHPNADSLRLYVFSNGEKKYEIVANLSNSYEIGDRAIIALAGSTLKDGTKLKETRIRGEISCGMALGKSDLLEGVDVTQEYCIPNEVETKELFKWPSIESLFNVRKYLNDYNLTRKIKYRFKVKCHGSNASVVINPDGSFYAQSRNNIINSNSDNAGFAKFVEDNSEYFSSLRRDYTFIIFGEWLGSGIQSGVAAANIGRKIFCPFAIQFQFISGEYYEINPKLLEKYLPAHKDIFILPWYSEEVVLNYSDTIELQVQIGVINDMVLCVEKEDPFIKENFGISGIGEGVVAYPLPDDYSLNESILVSKKYYTDLVFKAKGGEHKAVKTKLPVQLDPEVAKNIGEFVELFCTEDRLKQIANNIGDFNSKNTGKFLKEFNQDVLKESVAELDAANMSWLQVNKAVGARASSWYMDQCRKI